MLTLINKIQEDGVSYIRIVDSSFKAHKHAQNAKPLHKSTHGGILKQTKHMKFNCLHCIISENRKKANKRSATLYLIPV
jgi:hypothetical protein